MRTYDFEYDGITLSSIGYIVCSFDSGGSGTTSNGSVISFNTVSTLNGAKHELTSSVYEECLTATFQICKHPCMYHDADEISVDELRDIMQWLNRKTFHKLRILNDEYIGMYFEASFNVSKVEMDGKIFGLELEMTTNRPFALQDDVVISIDNDVENGVREIISRSDDEGYIYPDMEIVVAADGDLVIHNDLEDRTMVIANCRAGEIITVEYPMIRTSIKDHKVQNDFNWRFFRIATTFKNRRNRVTISLPCSITMRYSPVAKVGI